MKVLSLFSGIGGFDLGFQRVGMDIVAMCEIDKYAQKILKRHFPYAKLHDDVRKVSYEQGTIDLICGGFPCQDLSLAGKRRGLDGQRSGLWFEFARIIKETKPKWVVIENVQGLLSSNGGADFTTVIQWLVQCGYGVGWRVLDSQGFGLAQRRKRVFIVGSYGSKRGCEILLEQNLVQVHNRKTKEKGYNNPKENSFDVVGDSRNKINSFQEVYSMQGADDFLVNYQISFTLTKSNVNKIIIFEEQHKNGKIRRMTPIECERLQGFDDNWTAGQSDTQRYMQLGNAVSVNVAEWIGNRIMKTTLQKESL